MLSENLVKAFNAQINAEMWYPICICQCLCILHRMVTTEWHHG